MGSNNMRPRRQSMSDAEGAEVPMHEHRSVCPLMTHDKWSLSERANNAIAPPMKAYKLGKERWSYNQLKVEIHDSAQKMRLDPRLAKTIDPKTLPVRQQGYSAAFDMEFTNSSRLKVVFYICYSVPRRIATEAGHMWEWDLVTREHCKNGCPGPILRPIQRLGKLGKRSNVPQTETADPNQTKDPKFVYLSIDECGSHVGNRKTTFFRLVVGAYEVIEDRKTLLGTTCSEPFTVVRNNDNTEGASYSPIQIPVKHTWAGWSIGLVQMHDLPHVHLPTAAMPKSPNMSTSPLSTNSVVPLYDGSWQLPRRPDQPPMSARQLFQPPEAPHNGFTHLESSRLQYSSTPVVQTGGGTFPLPSYNATCSHNDSATSGMPGRWGGAARRTGRARAQSDNMGSREDPSSDFHAHIEAHGPYMTGEFHQAVFHERQEPQASFHAHREADRRQDLHQELFHQTGDPQHGSPPCADLHSLEIMEILSRRQFQQREDFQQGLLTRMGSHSQQHTAEEYGEPAHMQYGAACMDTQYAGFKRPWPIATQQSETAEEFRFMLPEQSQAPLHKRARIIDDEHSPLPFACLPAHSLSYNELPRHHSMPSMHFSFAPLPSVVVAGPSPRAFVSAPQPETEPSQPSSSYAGEPAADSAPYAEENYQDADKEGHVEVLQTMLSDPESLAPALPLEISFTADQASRSSRVAGHSAGAHPVVSTNLEDYPHTEQLPAEVLKLPPHFLLAAQYLGQQLSGLPPLRTSSSFGQDSWGSQSMTPSAGEPSISDFISRPIGAEGQLSLQEEEFVDALLRKEPAGTC